MNEANQEKINVYPRYPLSSVLIYNGVTVLHYLLGGAGIILGYDYTKFGFPLGAAYMAFAFIQMYLIMPLAVCPKCVYFRMNNARCISGLNVFSRKIARQGNLENFAGRAKGILSHNNLYMSSLIIPVLAMLPAVIVNFSLPLLALLLAVVGLMVFRIFVVFPKIACVHCCAKKECPNAQSMGLA